MGESQNATRKKQLKPHINHTYDQKETVIGVVALTSAEWNAQLGYQ